MAKILIPTPLRQYADKRDSFEAGGATVGEALQALTTQFQELRRHLYSDEGKLRSFVNIYVNDEDIRYLQKEQTPVKPGDSLSIVPSVAGGCVPTRSPRMLARRPSRSFAQSSLTEAAWVEMPPIFTPLLSSRFV